MWIQINLNLTQSYKIYRVIYSHSMCENAGSVYMKTGSRTSSNGQIIFFIFHSLVRNFLLFFNTFKIVEHLNITQKEAQSLYTHKNSHLMCIYF